MSKRDKVTFETINKGNYTIIDPKEIAEINERIKKEMSPIIRDFEQKEFESWLQANKNLKK
jgi:hypothetical protein